MVRCRRPLILASVVAVAAFSLLAAGCGGGGSPGVASVASSDDRRHDDDADRTRSPSPAACAPTGCRDAPTPTAAECSTKSKLERNSGTASPAVRAAEDGPCNHLLPNGSASAGHDHPCRSGRLPQGRRMHALARASRLPRPDVPEQQRQVQHPVEHRPGLSQVQERAGDLPKLIPAGLPYSGTS